MNRLVAMLLPFALGCAPAAEPPAGGAEDAPVRPTDSLALRTAEGWEVWFTAARDAHHQDGTPCLERGLEIRRDTLRRAIPLLYTREAPVPGGSGVIRAVLYNHCEPVASYRVDLETARPTRLP